MSQYYFLSASLPYLTYDEEHARTPEEFLTEARDHLTATDLQMLSRASIDAPVELQTAPQVISEWQRFERGLRNELVRIRAAARSADPERYVRRDEGGADETDHSGVPEIAREAFGEESPLSGEDVLARARWRFLDELEVGHYFDLDKLIVYYLKLQLIARRRQFTTEAGREAFTAATEKIMNEYYQEQGDV